MSEPMYKCLNKAFNIYFIEDFDSGNVLVAPKSYWVALLGKDLDNRYELQIVS